MSPSALLLSRRVFGLQRLNVRLDAIDHLRLYVENSNVTRKALKVQLCLCNSVIVNKSRPCGLRDELRQLATAFFEVSTIVIASGGFRSSHPQRDLSAVGL